MSATRSERTWTPGEGRASSHPDEAETFDWATTVSKYRRTGRLRDDRLWLRIPSSYVPRPVRKPQFASQWFFLPAPRAEKPSGLVRLDERRQLRIIAWMGAFHAQTESFGDRNLPPVEEMEAAYWRVGFLGVTQEHLRHARLKRLTILARQR